MSETDELRDYVGRLMRADDDTAFLVVTVAGSEDFLQLSGDSEGVQIDFPLITGRQRGLESSIRATAEREGLAVLENLGSDGSRFLDVNMKADAGEVARVCRAFLREVFGAGEGTRLEFKGDGLAA
jgi:hypothetical protein